MNVSSFLIKWKQADLTERSGAQQHFCDLCELFEHPKPAEADPKGEWFTFEKGAAKHGGGEGWADVWKKGFFAWEYKGKHKDLNAAYDQLLKYREALENPPLLCVCDMDRIIVHTNFTGTPTKVYEIRLLDFKEPDNLEILRAVFHDPYKLKPGTSRQAITEQAAQRLAAVAQSLRSRGFRPHKVARFLDRIVFCLFAEDIGLLPQGTFSEILDAYKHAPDQFSDAVAELFAKMASGGRFGARAIKHFDGNLFENAETLQLEYNEIESIWLAAKLDWGAVDASIFGTLFERGVDPAKRSQLGLHYTGRADIETLVEPVVMAPLRREWRDTRKTIESRLAKASARKGHVDKARHEGEILINRFLLRLSKVTVLDPACGSGNFLYVTLQKLKDLEKQAILYAAENGLGAFTPAVGPWQLHGIEISPYAFELAQLTVWIGYLQWLIHNGFGAPHEPILRPMHTFECKDAILERVAQPPSAVQDVPQQPRPVPPSPLAKPARGRYKRNLPHIQSEGKTYFVTFRTRKGRALPESVRGLVLQHCLRDHGTKLLVHAAVVMPDHVHLVYTPLQDSEGHTFSLEEIHNGIKGASAHSVNKALATRGHLWQDESFDHILRSHESARSKAEYICQNPVRKGLVADPDDYPWLWREWVEGAEGHGGSRVAQPPSAVDVAQPPSAVDVAQPPSAAQQQPKPREDTAEGGCATQQWAEPEWPKVDFIVGNPPFLGGKFLRRELGDEYVEALFQAYQGRVPAEADLCCYWFEKARKQIQEGKCQRAGLLATQAIRGGANREVLKRIKATGDIFFAESDRPWVLDGANVHISMVGFDNGAETARQLDAEPVSRITPALTDTCDITEAARLSANRGVSFMADTKGGPFDIDETLALRLLHTPTPSGRPMSDVILPWVNGRDITARRRGMWIIDFGVGMSESHAALYEAAFEYVRQHVKPLRDKVKRESYRRRWWQHVEPRPNMRAALGLSHVAQPPSAVHQQAEGEGPEPRPSMRAALGLSHVAQPPPAVHQQAEGEGRTAEGGCATRPRRHLGTPRVTKHRLFVWLELPILSDAQLIVFARSDDYFFGVLHSRLHEVWARAQGTQLRERESGFRYTPTTCFETFPFPCGTAALGCAGGDPASGITAGGGCATQVVEAIGEAARELNELRERWLNPPEWTRTEVLEFPGTVGGPWTRYIVDVAQPPSAESSQAAQPGAAVPHGKPRIGTVRYPRLVPRDAECAKKLKKRTLTNLYNERPAWLAKAHEKLDNAVFAAYGWDPAMSDEEILEKLLALNLAQAAAQH